MIDPRRLVLGACVAIALGGCSSNGESESEEESQSSGEVDTSIPVGPVSGGGSGHIANLFFLHHSTGDGLIVGGDMRSVINDYNGQNRTSFVFWDHGYNGDGLRNPSGNPTGTSYEIPDDNTDTEGLHRLWTGSDGVASAARSKILANHHLIAFKSCFPNSAIGDAEMLNQYKEWYVAMRNVFDAHRERVFVVMPPPPLHRLATNGTEAANARAFANWLCSSSYLSGHSNVACFNLFDQLAAPDDGSSRANRLRYEYEGSHNDEDSHPNERANQAVGPELARFLCRTAKAY